MKMITKTLTILSLILLSCPVVYAASISGTVAFTGTAPAAEKISMGADPSCSALHSGPVMTENVVVNANGTLKNVFVYIKTGLEGKSFPVPTEKAILDQQGCQYLPHVAGLQVGQELEILNSDGTLHNVHGMPEKSKEFNLGMPIKGMKLKRKFKEPEVMVKFKCDVHPWMSAYVGILSHPYYNVTNEEGAFSLSDVPPGTYTIEAWHETYGVQSQEITVTDGDQTIEFSFAG